MPDGELNHPPIDSLAQDVARPFVIFATPRSRTFWLSRFLSYGGWSCSHEEAVRLRGIGDIKSWLSQDMVGTVETAAAPHWRILRKLRPDAKIVVLRRPIDDVVKSFAATGTIADVARLTADLRRLDYKLDQIEKRIPGVLSLSFDDLADESKCAELFEFCLPHKHDHAWWNHLSGVNLQINLPALFRYAAAHAEQLRLITSLCTHESKRIIWGKGKQHDLDGMTIQEEPLREWFDGVQKLAKEHAFAVGEAEDAIFHKNISLMDQLDNVGALQIVTARSNGRMFGYLMTVLGPGLEDDDPNLKIAVQTLFYASPDARGVGARLQRASIEGLKARGGRWDIIQKSGTRADGPRLGAMFRRMGSEPLGELFKFPVGSA